MQQPSAPNSSLTASEQQLEQQLEQLISTSLGRRYFLAALPFLLTACATGSKHRQREGDNSGQETVLTVNDERKMTQEVIGQMQKEYPPVQDPLLQQYINSLGQRVVNANGLNNNPYQYNFTLVQANFINAFALPAGTIYVTAPLLTAADSEAELAGVIGHEIGHVKARHTAERMDKAKKEQGKSWLYGVGGGLLGGAAGFGLGKLLCRKNDQKCMQNSTLIGAAAGAGGGLLIQKFAFMANSREDEMEADRIGFRTSVAAGYSKDHVGKFYEKLLQMEREAKGNQNALLASFSDAMSTHPPSQERVDQMLAMASNAPASGQQVVSSKEFDRAKKAVEQYAKS